ncbi:ATP-binding protein [Streptomyces sp. NPDC000594]|uniref:ATP-binding protein n=1 Tax=Streptomyces sp. NPDC000594 TaxID=3154261 RepID=UPI00331A8DE8
MPGSPISADDARRPGQIRRIMRASLRAWGLEGLAGAAELVTSELVTNAFVHGRGPEVRLRLLWTAPGVVRVEVSGGEPVVLPSPRTDEGGLAERGRGLALVDACSDRWGLTDDECGVWFELVLKEGTA